MRILVTNDDGIHAPGLAVAEKIARALTDDVWVVAPETEQSGASHSLTLSQPLRLRQIEEKRFAITGTPTDCVMMAVAEVMKDKRPDLVLSGVNRGSNIADDVTYSGTIAGAMEGMRAGHSLDRAVSRPTVSRKGDVPWDCARNTWAGCHDEAARKSAGRRDVLMNMNFPDCAPGEVTGIEVTEQGKRDLQTADDRPAHRYARQSLLLDRLQTRAQQSAQGHRSARDLYGNASPSRRCI